MMQYVIAPDVTDDGEPTWKLIEECVSPNGVTAFYTVIARNKNKTVLVGAIQHLQTSSQSFVAGAGNGDGK